MTSRPAPNREPLSALHHGIDLASAARIEIQRLQRGAAAQDGLSPGLDRLEGTITELGDLLIQLRDSIASGMDPAHRT